jgi:hypothetical protein
MVASGGNRGQDATRQTETSGLRVDGREAQDRAGRAVRECLDAGALKPDRVDSPPEAR